MMNRSVTTTNTIGHRTLLLAGTALALVLAAGPAMAQIQSGGGDGAVGSLADGGGGGIAGGGGGGGEGFSGSGGDGGAGALPGQPAQAGDVGQDDGSASGGTGGAPGGPDLSAGGGGGGGGGDGDFGDGGAGGPGGSGGTGQVRDGEDVTLSAGITGGGGDDGAFPSSPGGYQGGGGGGGGAIVLTGAGSIDTAGHDVTGGAGGGGYAGGGGGAGIVTVDGGNVVVGSGTVMGGDGGNDFRGGDGAAGVFLFEGGNLDNEGAILGGGGGGTGAYGGAGGAGVLTNHGSVTNSGVVEGGAGGSALRGGHGGQGLMTYGGSVTNEAGARIAGGAGGDSTDAIVNHAGGNGGAGLVFVDGANGGTLDNFGTIAGGNGGAITVDGTPGAGGAGVVVHDDNVTIINAGRIAGGVSGHADPDDQVQAYAIEITGNNNRLELRHGYAFEGDVLSSGSGNILAFGGDANSSFDVGQIGGSAQFQGFDAFEKTGTSIWTLTGATSAMTPWTISQGTLVQGAAGAFAANTAFTVNGGTLDLNDFDLTISSLSGSGGTVDIGTADMTINQSGTTSYAGNITGTGGLTKLGEGTLTLTGTNTHESGTTVRAGTLVVDGGSITHPIAVGNDMTVGQAADDVAALRIENGGSVSNRVSYIGEDSGSEGRVTVTGPDSRWSNDLYLYVGYDGAGTLNITDGGTVENGAGFIGRYSDAEGTVTVTEGSSWTNSGDLRVGFFGAGTLNITAGGTVTSGNSFIGRGGSSRGTVVVTGSDSSWTVIDDADLTLGAESATGVLTIANEGEVTSTGNVIIADAANSEGLLSIGAGYDDDNGQWHDPVAAGVLNASTVEFGDGHGRLAFNHTDDDYTFDSSLVSLAGGTHTIEHLSGTTLLTGDSSGFTGTTTVSGGRFVVANNLGGNAEVSGGRFEVDGDFIGDVEATGAGAVSGTGTISGDVTFNSGGILSGRQGQTLTIGGDLILDAGSNVDVALGGAPADALFNVQEDLTLGGTLNVADQGGFGAGVYRLFDYGGALTDNGLAIGSTPAGVMADNLSIQTSVASEVNLVSTVGAELGFWDGGDASLHDNGVIDGGSGAWRADGRNWTDEDGALNGPYQPNPTFAIFQGQAGTVSVDASAGNVAVTGMQIAADGYRIEGDAIVLEGTGGESIIRVGDGTAAGADMTATIASELTGNSMLVRKDHGTLILDGVNSYTGGTLLDGGVLSVSDDANLGHEDGALSFDGGTLRVTGTGYGATDRAITLLADGGGFDIVEAGHSFTLTQDITGPGDLVMAGEGMLVLTGSNAYGDTRVRSGTLVGDAGSISGNIANAGTVAFDQGTDAGFAGNIAGLNGTDGDMILRGGGTLTLDGRSSLDWTVEDGALISASDRFTGDLDIATGGSFVFDQGHEGTYAGALSGAGDLALTGGGVVEMTGDSSGFTGLTGVTGATLLVNDTLGGSATIGMDGVLGGAGIIGSGAGSTVTIADGGTLSPGNSIGTLTVDGDLTFGSGSRFEVEVSPGGTDSDLVRVTGTAAINGGTVAHIGADGDYDLRSTYTILSADTLVGEFDAVTSAFRFLTPDLIHDHGAGTVDLELVRNDQEFVSAALTANQTATAEGIESIGFDAGHAVYDAIAQLADDDDLIRASFDALSGEVHASASTALIEDSRHLRNAANDRIRAAFGDVGASAAPVLAYGADGPVLAPADGNHLGMTAWGTAYGSWGSTDSDGNAGRIERNTGGVLFGADGLIADQTRLGLMAGYSRSSVDLGARASSADIDSYHLGLYGGTQWAMPEGTLSLRGGLAYSWHDVSTRRSVGFTGFSDSLSADYSANTFQTFGELGYGIETDIARFEPFINLAHVNVRSGGFTESGGASALTGASDSNGVTFTTLGVRAETDLDLGETSGRLHGTVGWRHAFGDVTPESTHAFAGSDDFTIAGSPIGRNALVLDAGLELDLTPDATLGLSYQGQVASGVQDHGVRARFNVRF